ncbi:MBL fold metallo-hydrolase [Pseudomonas sp. SA3-5]|uniref:MBL fold metallo-hydrolase n=1 Tax=Pseudomonas aestuarii TaxID=3018340 RepID=A0ABT4XIT2_9PSED|nr:MBL fold metallo-hydrolase [Pseudomonas aestuarii]MDA7088135.1 MBL fold metallo-hydrolase [Pseudomonas aestuarii]
MRTLTTLTGNSQKLDGGAMFGNAPKALWQRWMAADEQNRIDLGCRALLVQEEGRNILVETGIGAFFSPELKDRFGVQEDRHVLQGSLAELGLGDADIDIVLLTHLHFDHAGGLLAAWEQDQPPRLLFPNARYVTGKRQWQRACQPHARDRASYIPELLTLLESSDRLTLLEETDQCQLLGPGWRLHWSDGHTPGLLLPEVAMPGGPVLFPSDLIPGAPWVHLPITMGYDRFPEGLIEEKQALLADLLARGGRLVFTHDPQIAMGKVVRDAKGRYGLSQTRSTVRALDQ